MNDTRPTEEEGFRAVVEKVVRLSRLDPSGEDLDRLAEEFGAIVGFVRRLETVDTTSVEPMTHVHASADDAPAGAAREDVPAETLSAEAALANVPERVGTFIKVPLVLDES